MFKHTIIVTLLIFVIFTSANASDFVTFKGMTTNEVETPLMLTGKLTKPEGNFQ